MSFIRHLSFALAAAVLAGCGLVPDPEMPLSRHDARLLAERSLVLRVMDEQRRATTGKEPR